MQIKVEKYLFAGTKNTHDLFFERAQKKGMMEFISVSGKKPHLFPEEVQNAKDALKILSKHAKGEQESEAPRKIQKIVEEVIGTKEKLDLLYERKRAIKMEMIRIAPFGSFSMDQIHAIEEEGGREIQFFMMQHDRIPVSEVPSELLFVDTESNIDYFLYVGKEKFSHPAFTEVYVERSIDAAKIEMESTTAEIAKLEALELENCRYVRLMEEFIFAKMNAINLHFAKEDVDYYVEDKLFVIEAWIPRNRKKDLDALLDGLSIIVHKVAIDKDDRVPTHLKNKGFSRMGEDLVYEYDTPATDDKDPSGWVLWFFALFFGMIISDAGYGFIFLALSGFLWMKFGSVWKGAKKRAIKLLTLLSCSTIVWGVLIASYFSIQLSPGNWWNKISLPYQLAIEKVSFHKDTNSDLYQEWVKEYPGIASVDVPAQMLEKGTKIKDGTAVYELMNDTYEAIFLELSLIVGILHLLISFVRNTYRSWSGIGWIFVMVGGYLYIPKALDAYSMFDYVTRVPVEVTHLYGEFMMYGGLILVIVLSMLQARSISGITAIFKLIEVFSDVLSYLRLYALGLASMVLAGTFNELGPALGGPMFGWIIILFGHMINIILGVMAGVIHGLRLNFLEWYHHCYEGEGKKFQPLKILKSE